MSSIDYSLIMSALRLSFISEFHVNNGFILLYSVVTHALAVVYPTLVSKRLRLRIFPFVNKCTSKIIERDDVISFVDVVSNTVPTMLDGIHIGTSAGSMKFLNPFLGKRFCSKSGPIRICSQMKRSTVSYNSVCGQRRL